MQRKGLIFGTIVVLIAASLGFIGCEEDASSPRSSARDIVAFKLNDVEGAINEETARISVTLPAGTNVTALTPVAVVSAGARIIDPASGNALGTKGTEETKNQEELPVADFTEGKNYTVQAENGLMKVYRVIVTVIPEPVKSAEKAIVAFSIDGVDGVIDEAAKRIYVTLPAGTDVEKLSPIAITSAGASIVNPKGENVGVLGGDGEEDLPEADFTNGRSYIVQAEDGSTQIYSVIVSALPAPSVQSLAVSIGLPSSGEPVIFGVPEGGIKLSLGGDNDLPYSVIISVDGSVWSGINWSIDGTQYPTSTNIITVDAGSRWDSFHK